MGRRRLNRFVRNFRSLTLDPFILGAALNVASIVYFQDMSFMSLGKVRVRFLNKCSRFFRCMLFRKDFLI